MNSSKMSVFAFITLFAIACNNSAGNDSKAKADSINEKKEDNGSLNKKIDDDANFVTEARSGVLMEVELGSYAEKNAASSKVKEFGRRMVQDHSKDRDELQFLASKKNITIPDVPGEKFQKHIDELEKKKGSDFDKAYMSFMVSDHHDDIDEFEKESKNGKDADIVSFANKGLPVLKEHLSMAQSITDKLK
jgi:putative membrane protein